MSLNQTYLPVALCHQPGSISNIFDKFNIAIAIITEHKLKERSKSFLSTMHTNYNAYTTCEESDSHCGKGGVSILYKQSLFFCIKHIFIPDCNRIAGVNLHVEDSFPIFLFAVYMPSLNYEIDEYINCMIQLQGLNDSYTTEGIVLFCEDLNANITADMYDQRATTLRHFLQAKKTNNHNNQQQNPVHV